MLSENFYTYLYLREDFTPYYVGKGSGDRAYHNNHRLHVPKDKSRILIQEFPSEQDAFEAEKFLITYYGRIDLSTGCLRNLSDGGEGNTGIVVSEETRRKIGANSKGNTYWLGRTHSEEANRKNADAHRGKSLSEEHRRKIGAASKGNTNGLGHRHSEETRRRMSNTRRGRRHSEDSRQKMRAAAFIREAAKRAAQEQAALAA